MYLQHSEISGILHLCLLETKDNLRWHGKYEHDRDVDNRLPKVDVNFKQYILKMGFWILKWEGSGKV